MWVASAILGLDRFDDVFTSSLDCTGVICMTAAKNDVHSTDYVPYLPTPHKGTRMSSVLGGHSEAKQYGSQERYRSDEYSIDQCAKLEWTPARNVLLLLLAMGSLSSYENQLLCVTSRVSGLQFLVRILEASSKVTM
uniref:Uncharacterized protein n=1 Tax=Coccidioides posadasii RMSCC 3488 TaxID=454284 RepID=A0A0J6FMT0_COCPO|nr:hypothetical protein CPAG_07981 [Coccidioides posadasii RMSCC 3488]